MENAGVWTIREGFAIRLASGAFMRSVEEFREGITDFEWVVLQNPGTLGNAEILPSEPHLADLLKAISTDSSFFLSGKFAGVDGKFIYGFARKIS